MIYKNKGIIMADYIVEQVSRRCSEVSGYIDTFNNCREQGYIVYLFNSLREHLTIYVYAHRNTDLPTLTWEYAYGDKIYSEDAWLHRTVSYETVDYAVDGMVELIENYLPKTEN